MAAEFARSAPVHPEKVVLLVATTWNNGQGVLLEVRSGSREMTFETRARYFEELRAPVLGCSSAGNGLPELSVLFRRQSRKVRRQTGSLVGREH